MALLVCEWLRPWLDPVYDAPFIAAVVLTSWFCGPYYASASVLYSLALLDYFFLPPTGFAVADARTATRFFVFLAANSLIIALITHLFRVQADLEESEQLSRNLAELIPFGGWVADRSGSMIRLSESFLAAFHVTFEECRGLGWIDLIDDIQRDQVLADWKECMRKGFFWDYEYRMRSKTGENFIVLSRGVPVRNPRGQVRYWAGIHLDLTERENLAEQRLTQARDIARFHAELDQLAYVSAHDLQEPLRMIASYLQLIERRYGASLDRDAKTFIGYAVEGATRLQTLLTDLLALQQVGKGARPKTTVALSELVDKAAVSLGEFPGTLNCGPLPRIQCDAYEFGVLMENLIGNAVKYRRTDVPLEVSVSAVREGDEWVIAVADNGIGVEPEYLDRIFALFQRLHPRSKYPGTGIGLALSKKIVEVHGGRIWAESTPGQGTTVKFTVPVH
jgi:PAS domain S-box-containing protein